MKNKTKAKCPSCGGRIEHFPDQDSSSDWYCTRCNWHKHVPGNDEIVQVKKGRNLSQEGGDAV